MIAQELEGNGTQDGNKGIIGRVYLDGVVGNSRDLLVSLGDHGNDFSKATPAALDGVFAGQIEYAGDADFFRFEIAQAGRLIVSTTGSTDTIGTLYDSNQNPIVTVDDISTANFNFEINQNVFPGTYYLKVTSYLDSTGAYALTSAFTAAQTKSSQAQAETQEN